MGLNAKQQRNVEILIDQHFTDLRHDLNERRRAPLPKVEVTPELQELAQAQAEWLLAQDEILKERLTKYNEDLVALGFEPVAVPYHLGGTGENVENKTRGLVHTVTETVRNRLYRQEEAAFLAAYERANKEWRKAKRDVLVASLNGSEALTLIEGLIDLDTLLATTATTEETPA